MRLTKNDMARVIVQALYRLPELPAKDNCNVVRMANGNSADHLRRQHTLAVKLLLQSLTD